MDRIRITHPTKKIRARPEIPGSKSETNRVLILKELYFPYLELQGASSSNDSLVLGACLKSYRKTKHLNVEDAGTAMRFLCAFLAAQKSGFWILDGSKRMRERPISLLVSTLRQMGAKIEYLQKEGYPPLEIRGTQLKGGEYAIDGRVSSQFISALMMIGPCLAEGLLLRLKGFSVSTPYIHLTANIMRRLGLGVVVLGDEVKVSPLNRSVPLEANFKVEPDWSAASYWFLIVLLAEEAEVYLPGFKQYSLQGDSVVANLFAPLGVDAHFIGPGFRLSKSSTSKETLNLNLVQNPDLAQSFAVAAAVKLKTANIKGLQTLRIKETDRLVALQNELAKIDAKLEIGEDFLRLIRVAKTWETVTFETYKDHRMAMALAPLALLSPIVIEDPEVVRKSYPNFWEDLLAAGFEIKKLT
jgi:3-phosphoshikimate 1-carboxyvinyltransferase